jgi:hypothetical protein
MDYYHGSKPVGTSITLVAGNSYDIKLEGANSDGWGFVSSSSDLTVSTTSGKAGTRIALRAGAQAKPSVVTVSPTQRTVAPVASHHPHHSGKQHGPAAAAPASAASAPAPPAAPIPPPPALSVTIVPVLSLPPASSEEGALARMYLSEAQNPGYPPGQPYVLQDVIRSMRWMREVLDNQRNLSPRDFGAARDATRRGTTLIDMMRAHNNVAGFENYPAINSQMMDSLVRSANDVNQFMFEKYRKHVEAVLTEASRETKDCPVRVYSWRTAKSSDPGSNYKFYQTLAGQDFYTLDPDYEAALKKGQDKREAKPAH